MSTDMDDALRTFTVESTELLDEMEHVLVRIASGHGTVDNDAVNTLFRAAHTVKGTSGLFGLERVVAFTHDVEHLLERARAGRIVVDRKLADLLLSCCDHIRLLIAAGKAGSDDAQMRELEDALTAQLASYLDSPTEPEQTAVASGNWHISLRFGRDLLRNGLDPLACLRYLGQLGFIAGIETVDDALPEAQQMDPESCYLGFEIAFAAPSCVGKADIEEAFEFVRDDCTLRILPPHSRIADYIRLINEAPEGSEPLGRMLVRCGSVTERELELALAAQRAGGSVKPLGTILVEERMSDPVVVETALMRQAQARLQDQLHLQDAASVRVDAARLDRLIDLIGELAVAGSSADLTARRSHNTEMQEHMAQLSTLINEVRDRVLQLRMVKIGATFNRFHRIVHDVAQQAGKQIRLEIHGEDTELDRTVVEKIADPLTHLVRNAIDHGIEPAAVRAAAGKPAVGTVRLDAWHESASVVIQVSDDGGGLQPERIRAKAIERGLVSADQVLSEREVFNLIFEPGFSTAEQVTSLSGRGVGMDVVKRNITALRGTVDIDSKAGAGTAVRIRMPLTLAIINGFLAGVGGSLFVVPLEQVEECAAFNPAPGQRHVNLRGEALPCVQLRELFSLGGTPGDSKGRENLIVVRHGAHRVGLVVDTLLGEFQTVVKPMAKMFSPLMCVSGSSILGSGEVALILDVGALFESAEKSGCIAL